MKKREKEKQLKGTPIIQGMGQGRAVFVGRSTKIIQTTTISENDVGVHIMEFNRLREKAKQIYQEYNKKESPVSADSTLLPSIDSSIIDIYTFILDDPAFIGEVVAAISTQKLSVQSAIQAVSNDFITRFNANQSTYFRERAGDMVEICELLLSLISGDVKKQTNGEPIVIIVPGLLIPSDILTYKDLNLRGIVASNAALTSHAVILARTYNIPLVSNIGPKRISKTISQNVPVLIDGFKGIAHIYPSKKTISKFNILDGLTEKFEILRKKWKNRVYTKDGVHIHVLANIALPDDIDYAHKCGADDIGLVRSEFLFFQNNKMPQYNEQVEYYKQIFSKSTNLHPVIRILDIGGDKIPSYMKIPKEFNPFMGWRGIRFLLKKRDFFEEHLSTIMTAADNNQYALMIPMVSSFAEWREAKQTILQIGEKLKKPVPKLGILFEVPLALLEMRNFLPELDFASIGTNDLIQYLLAADRNNANVSYLHNPIDPPFINIIHNAIMTAKRAGKPISICGEIAGNPLYTILLLGIGLTRFSMTPYNIPIIKEIISRVSFSQVQDRVTHLLRNSRYDESVKKFVYNLNKELLDKFYQNFNTYFELIENSDV